jgi:DNA-binding IclR family transcriptional regulator
VGNAVPHRPPFGAVLVAWSGADDVDRWLARAEPALTAKERTRYRRALREIRDHGYSVAVYQADLADAITADVMAEPGTQAARRRRDRALAGLGHSAYLTTELATTRRHAISMISAPVFDHDGRAEALLLLTGFPMEMDLAEVRGVGGRLNAAARRLTASVGGMWPRAEPPTER